MACLTRTVPAGVAQYVAAAGYRNCPAILAHFLRLVRLDRAQHTATIESASPLPADVQAAIQASLASRYGAGLNTVFTSRPSLIGGMRIQVGSDVYDGSVPRRAGGVGEKLLKARYLWQICYRKLKSKSQA